MVTILSRISLIIVSILFLGLVDFSQGEIGPDIASTIKIVSQLCRPFHHSTWTAMKFFACYDTVTGRDHFIECQKRVFGSSPNTMWRVESLCLQTNRGTTGWDAYNNCIVGEWNKAGLDISLLIQAGTFVNKCQAGVVGVN